MSTTTTKKTITIAMSERAPLKLDTSTWPVVASAEHHDGGQIACQARNEWRIIVREHADGRRIVYGCHEAGGGGQYAGFRPSYAGYLLATPVLGEPTEGATVRAIRRIAGVIGNDQLGDECIADLPAEELA